MTVDESEEYRSMYGQEMGYEPTPERQPCASRRRPVRRNSVTEQVLRAQQQELLSQQQPSRNFGSGYHNRTSQRDVMRQIPRSAPRPRNPYILAKAQSMACVVRNVDFESEPFHTMRRDQTIRRDSINRSTAPRAA
jgi:hypothetical protein